MQSKRLSTTSSKRMLRLAAGALLCAAFTVADLIDAGAAEPAANMASAHADASPSTPSSETRKVRVIDMTAGAANSDGSHWHNRVAKPAAAKNAAAIAAAMKPEKTKKVVRRAPPREPDARSAFASAPEERRGFGLFFRR